MNQLLRMLLALSLAGCSTPPPPSGPEAELSPVRSHPVTVVNHGWHGGLILPAAALNRRVPALERRFAEAESYEVGWGDVDYYQADEATSGLAVQALFRSRGSVLHVVALTAPPERSFAAESRISTCLSTEELAALTAFVASSFSRDASGGLVALKPGTGAPGQFYAAEGRYNLLNTCNQWIARALRRAGFDLVPALLFSPDALMDYLELNRRPCAPQGDGESAAQRAVPGSSDDHPRPVRPGPAQPTGVGPAVESMPRGPGGPVRD